MHGITGGAVSPRRMRLIDEDGFKQMYPDSLVEEPTLAELQEPWREEWKRVKNAKLEISKPAPHVLKTSKPCPCCGAAIQVKSVRCRPCNYTHRQRVEPPPQTCPVCTVEFGRRPDEELWQFLRRKTCSPKCAKALSGLNRSKRDKLALVPEEP